MSDLHVAEVTRTRWLTPGMVRVTFGGLHEFRSTGVGDEYVRVQFPGEHIEPYTIRRHDPVTAEVDIDLVVHGHGHAGRWAAQASPGDRVSFTDPRGLYQPPTDARQQLFVTDATGIPALGRLIEQLDRAVHAVAVVEVAQAAHRLDLGIPVQWVVGRGNGVAASAITEVLRELPLSDDCYVWVAGEAGELREARRYLRHERGLPPERYEVIGYWRHRSEDWLARYQALDADTVAALATIWDGAEDEEVRRDRYDDRLDSLGL